GDTEENIFGVTDGAASAGIYIDNGATTYAQVQFGSTSNHDLGFFTNNGLPGITLTTTGNVGIGTANPDSGYKLDVIGALAINDEMAISQDGTTQNHISFLHSDSFESASDVWRLRVGGSDTPDGLAFGFFDNTPNLWLDSDGSVGVGTVTPSAQLDVDGTIRAS